MIQFNMPWKFGLPLKRFVQFLAILESILVNKQTFILILMCCGYANYNAQGASVAIFSMSQERLHHRDKKRKWLKQHQSHLHKENIHCK